MGASFDDLAAAIAAEMWWSSLGYWILAIGLAGDILVLVIPRHRERLEKILSAVFIVIIIFGVTIEHNADTRIAVLVSQQEVSARLEIAKLKGPRILNPKQMADLIAKLGLYAGKGFWIITQKAETDRYGEQIDLSGQLSNVFTSAGWRKSNHSNKDSAKVDQEFTQPSDRGCGVGSAYDPVSIQLGKAVLSALQDAGIDCVPTPDPEIMPDFIVIEVALR